MLAVTRTHTLDSTHCYTARPTESNINKHTYKINIHTLRYVVNKLSYVLCLIIIIIIMKTWDFSDQLMFHVDHKSNFRQRPFSLQGSAAI